MTIPQNLSNARKEPDKGSTWLEYLHARIDDAWRPGEFDPETLVFTPDPDHPYTALTVCAKADCRVRLDRGELCPTCRADWLAAEAAGSDTKEQWLQIPREYRTRQDCRVEECPRRAAARGLCKSHSATAGKWMKRQDRPSDVDAWIAATGPTKLPDMADCMIRFCRAQADGARGLCSSHHQRFLKWSRAQVTPELGTIERWTKVEIEIPVGDLPPESYRESGIGIDTLRAARGASSF